MCWITKISAYSVPYAKWKKLVESECAEKGFYSWYFLLLLKLGFLSKVFWLSKRQAVLEVTFLSSLCVLLLYYCYDCLRCDKVCRYHYLLWNWSNFKSKDNKCPVIIWISHHCTDSDCQVNHKGAILVDQWPIQRYNKIDSKITILSWDNCNLLLGSKQR